VTDVSSSGLDFASSFLKPSHERNHHPISSSDLSTEALSSFVLTVFAGAFFLVVLLTVFVFFTTFPALRDSAVLHVSFSAFTFFVVAFGILCIDFLKLKKMCVGLYYRYYQALQG